MISQIRGFHLIRFLVLISLTVAALFGQSSARGTVQGTVKDATGGIIRGASVTLATDSGTVQTVDSGQDGTYTFRNVAPGNYTVSATFKKLFQVGRYCRIAIGHYCPNKETCDKRMKFVDIIVGTPV